MNTETTLPPSRPSQDNNEEAVTPEQFDQFAAASEYRELKIDPPQPPLRMAIEPPMEFDGEKFAQLIFDFDAMNGKFFQRCEREFNHLYKPDKDEMVLPEVKHLYHQIIAKNLANVPLGVIQKLSRRQYVPLRLEVLKACGSSPDEEKA